MILPFVIFFDKTSIGEDSVIPVTSVGLAWITGNDKHDGTIFVLSLNKND